MGRKKLSGGGIPNTACLYLVVASHQQRMERCVSYVGLNNNNNNNNNNSNNNVSDYYSVSIGGFSLPSNRE